jgi:hypothetical protein
MDAYLSSLSRAYSADPSNENAHRLARAFSRVSPRAISQKVLISPKFGSGWSTNHPSARGRRIMRTHEATIAAVEAGDEITEESSCIIAMIEEIRAAGDDIPYLGALRDKLKVIEVEGPYSVEEYDGCESIRTMSSFED